MNNSWIYTYKGTWSDEHGHTLIIQIIDDENAIVDFYFNGSPIKRPWCNDEPSIGLKASYDFRESASLEIDLGFHGFIYSVGLVCEDGTLSTSISRYEDDEHLDQFYELFGKTGYYLKKMQNKSSEPILNTPLPQTKRNPKRLLSNVR